MIAELIYMVDGQAIDPALKDERLITRKLGPGNFKILRVDKKPHCQIVHLEKLNP